MIFRRLNSAISANTAILDRRYCPLYKFAESSNFTISNYFRPETSSDQTCPKVEFDLQVSYRIISDGKWNLHIICNSKSNKIPNVKGLWDSDLKYSQWYRYTSTKNEDLRKNTEMLICRSILNLIKKYITNCFQQFHCEFKYRYKMTYSNWKIYLLPELN